MKNNQRGFMNMVFMGVGAVVLIIGLLGYFGFRFTKKSEPITEQPAQIPVVAPANTSAQAPKDETVNWKTYRNEEYGFEVEYSSSWAVKKIDDNDIRFVGGIGGKGVLLSMKINPDQISLTEWTQEDLGQNFTPSIKKVTSFGINYLWYNGILSLEDSDNSIIYFGNPYPSTVFILQAYPSTKYKNEIEHFLSTFKFTSPQ